MIVVQYSNPQTGTLVKGRIKIGFSWTILFFGYWALLFRGQWMEFFIFLVIGLLLTSVITYSEANANSEVNNLIEKFQVDAINSLEIKDVDTSSWVNGDNIVLANIPPAYYANINSALNAAHPNLSDELFAEFYKSMTATNWVIYVFGIVAKALARAVFVLFGNKWRLRKLYDKTGTMTFDLPENDNPDDIYDYINVQRRASSNNDLKPGVVQGQTHQYVVPDKALEEPVEDYDYSTLTIQDLKLLLKSEGIPFAADSSKEELLELVEENIAKEQRATQEKELAKYNDSMYHTMTVQELVAELDKKNIAYTSNMRKNDLIKLLVDNEKSNTQLGS